MQYGVVVPRFFDELLKGSELRRLVEVYLATFSDWYESNETVFFREYTDHGIKHVQSVLETAEHLISATARELFSSEDAAVLICSTILHDVALHFQEASFISIVTSDKIAVGKEDYSDLPWRTLWKDYDSEMYRIKSDERELVFGSAEEYQSPNMDDPESWTKLQHRYIGEFLRRNHPRLAYEVSVAGVPASLGNLPIDAISSDDPLSDYSTLSGMIARSHGCNLRTAFEPVAKRFGRTTYREACHPLYIMTLLRISDYLQLRSDRANSKILQVKRIRSPLSSLEWQLHDTVDSVGFQRHDDPEVFTVQIAAKKTNIELFLKAERLIADLQRELDTCWAVLGEHYGRYNERKLGLTIRRIRSNIEAREEFGRQAGYIPDDVRFTAADSDLIQLLIKPLYGDYPGIAVRELVQNAVDACRERAFLEYGPDTTAWPEYTVSVSVSRREGGGYVLCVEDSGIGMDLQILKKYFLNAGASYRGSLGWKKLFTDQDRHSLVLRSGRFGVGALAAFLLADDPREVTIRVHTRRLNTPQGNGLQFETSLSQRAIAVRYSDKQDFGTKIEIETTSAPQFILSRSEKEIEDSSDAWDWYCLDWPKVERRALNGTLLKPRHRMPASRTSENRDFRWLSVRDFQDVGWTFAPAPAVVCNGILVMKEYNYRFSAPKLLEKKGLVSSVEVPMPNLVVFDRDGKLPLTLDRLRLDFDQLSFLGDLRRSVAVDFFCATLVSAPEDCTRKALRNSERLFRSIVESGAKLEWKTLPWLFYKGQVSLFNDASIKCLASDEIVELNDPDSVRHVVPEKRELVAVCVSSHKNSLHQSDIEWPGRYCYIYTDEEDLHEVRRFEIKLREQFEMNAPRHRRPETSADIGQYQDFFRGALDTILGSKGAAKASMKRHWMREELFESASDFLASAGDAQHALRRLYDLYEREREMRVGLGSLFSVVDRCMMAGIDLSRATGRTFGSLVVSANERPRAEKRFKTLQNMLVDQSTVDWDSIPEREGDNEWFLAHWKVGELKQDRDLPHEEIWRAYIPDAFVPAKWSLRESIIASLSNEPELAPHLERAVSLRNAIIDGSNA